MFAGSTGLSPDDKRHALKTAEALTGTSERPQWVRLRRALPAELHQKRTSPAEPKTDIAGPP
jgi:hypothetical protein